MLLKNILFIITINWIKKNIATLLIFFILSLPLTIFYQISFNLLRYLCENKKKTKCYSWFSCFGYWNSYFTFKKSFIISSLASSLDVNSTV